MTYGTRTDRYPPTSKILHWLVAPCVLITLPVAVVMVWVLREGPLQDAFYNLHKSLGLLIFILMTLRLINRIAAGAPVPEPGIERWQKVVSSAVHGALYVLLLAMPVVGYIANSAYGAATPFFGLFTLPPIIDQSDAVSKALFTLHRWVGWVVILLVGLHISGALYHHFVRGDNVLRRMLPEAIGGAKVGGAKPDYAAARQI